MECSGRLLPLNAASTIIATVLAVIALAVLIPAVLVFVGATSRLARDMFLLMLVPKRHETYMDVAWSPRLNLIVVICN